MVNLHANRFESDSNESNGTAITKRLFHFLTFPLTTEQSVIQQQLLELYKLGGLPLAMNTLYNWELRAGYISEQKLEGNERFSFFDAGLEIDFQVQVNRARSGYTPGTPETDDPTPLHCTICKENIGRPGKETLRIFEIPNGLGGRDEADNEQPGRRYFVQLTPFPVFPYHFVVITDEPVPMQIDRRSMLEMVQFASMAPAYTVCSNSDVEGTGSSILEHHHLQVCRGLTLPAMTADALRRFKLNNCTVDILRYPLASVHVWGEDETFVLDKTVSIVEGWKSLDPEKNSVNLIFTRECGVSNFYIFFRNPKYKTPTQLQRIKSEGIGIIEAAGAGIFPVPSGPDEDVIWDEIRSNGKAVMKGILEGINPVTDTSREEIVQLIVDV